MYRRIEVDGSGQASLRERENPVLRPGSVRIQVQYCSVNRGDIERLAGSYGGVDAGEMGFWRTDESGLFVPGYEPAGVVVEVAKDADPTLLGRSVILHSHETCGGCIYCRSGLDNLCGKMRVYGVGTPGTGGWSEEIVVPAAQVLPLGAGVDMRGSCTYEVTYGTALHNLRRGLALVELAGPVAVRGVPGGVALAAAQFCVALGLPCAAIVRDPDSARAQQVRRLLPEVAVVGERDGRQGVMRALGAPPALVIDPLGGDYIAADVELVARGGAVGVLGTHLGATSALRIDQVFLKSVAVYGTPRAPTTTMVEVAEMVEAGRVTPIVDRTFALEDFASTIQYCEHPTGIGRVLLAMNGDG